MENLLTAKESCVITANVIKQTDDHYRPMIEKIITDAIDNAIKNGNYAVSIDFESESLRLCVVGLLQVYFRFKKEIVQDLVDAGYTINSYAEVLSISWRNAGADAKAEIIQTK